MMKQITDAGYGARAKKRFQQSHEVDKLALILTRKSHHNIKKSTNKLYSLRVSLDL